MKFIEKIPRFALKFNLILKSKYSRSLKNHSLKNTAKINPIFARFQNC
jgi:hypothetical protein